MDLFENLYIAIGILPPDAIHIPNPFRFEWSSYDLYGCGWREWIEVKGLYCLAEEQIGVINERVATLLHS